MHGPNPAIKHPIPMHPRVGFLKSLRTLRTFEQHKPVPENVLQDVLEVARWSGSARNRQQLLQLVPPSRQV